MSAAPKGRSFLNDAMDEATSRRRITTLAPWAQRTDEDVPPAPGEESRRAMSATVRRAAGFTDTDTDTEESS